MMRASILEGIRARAVAAALLGALLAAVLASCGRDATVSGAPGDAPGGASERAIARAGAGSPTTSPSPEAPTRPIDPRRDGLEVALGEWAVTAEANAIRPGRVTFVVRNRGTIGHGFEIKGESEDSSGPGSGDELEAETGLLQPGETARLSMDLPAGIYEVECFVEGHDDRGMQGILEVRPGAPKTRPAAPGAPAGAAGDGSTVLIQGFSFAPRTVEVPVGGRVSWTNEDPAEHTVTAEDGSFDSSTLAPGAGFETRLDQPGEIAYLCSIHPDMRGSIVVRG
jgi:plastocyanin